jgi:hypothetical protein
MKKGMKGTKPSFCVTHPSQEINSFCQDCKIVVCSECAVDLHSKHEFAKVSLIAGQVKYEISKKMRSGLRRKELSYPRKSSRMKRKPVKR